MKFLKNFFLPFLFILVALFFAIKLYFAESLKNHVKFQVFDECFLYYSLTDDSSKTIINTCLDKAENILK